MRITLRLIFSLVAVVGLVAWGFSAWQANKEEQRLKTEIEHRAGLIAEGLTPSVENLVQANAVESLERILNRFSNRERLLGVSVHDMRGNLTTASTGLKKILKDSPAGLSDVIAEVEKTASTYGSFIKLDKKQLHAYCVPLTTDDGKPSAVLTIFHDRSYIRERVWRIWLNSFWRASLQVFVIALTTLIIVYLNVMKPIRKTTAWVKRVRLGQTPESYRLKPDAERLLGPLAKEVSSMVKSLEMARMSAEEEARLRHASESLWTAERLKEWVREKLQGRQLFVVSNREPYMHFRKGREIETIVPASGLVTAVEPVLKACGGTWIAQGSGSADRETSDAQGKLRVPPDDPQYTLKRVWLTKEEERGYYYGFANEGLWPLCHIAHTRPTFRPQDWMYYQQANQKFARAVLEELKDMNEPCVLIQDYHFALLPRLIKEARPDARVSIFWHIPWPNPESFGICPWQKELLEGMLGADVIGFHTQFHCNNFIESVDRFLESRIDYEHFTITRSGHATWVRPFPISIDFLENGRTGGERASASPGGKEALLKKYGLSAEFLGVGVDRLDYTKGILERFRGIESFLHSNPQYQGKFVFAELGAPSRTFIPRYADFDAEIEREADRINAGLRRGDWRPILFLKKHHSHEDIRLFYEAADFCLVTSLHDGMNLVAKEFAAARQDEKGVLILSQFTGAARDLQDALIINPYDVDQMAMAVKTALEMPLEEQVTRMKRMRHCVRERNIYKWAADLVAELGQVRLASVP